MRYYWGNQFALYDEKEPIEAIVTFLTDRKIIPPCENMYDGFDEFRKYIYDNFYHNGFYTSISPEDEVLLYVMSKIMQPKSAFVGGAYYGYFAVWAMRTISDNGGTIVLSDVNRDVCILAMANFINLGYEKNTKVYCEDAIKLLSKRTEPIDMMLLDAVGRYDDPRPEYRGKRIYVPMLEAARHLLKKGSAIVLHNMRPRGHETKVLVDKLHSLGAVGTSYDSSAGIGVYIVQ